MQNAFSEFISGSGNDLSLLFPINAQDHFPRMRFLSLAVFVQSRQDDGDPDLSTLGAMPRHKTRRSRPDLMADVSPNATYNKYAYTRPIGTLMINLSKAVEISIWQFLHPKLVTTLTFAVLHHFRGTHFILSGPSPLPAVNWTSNPPKRAIPLLHPPQ